MSLRTTPLSPSTSGPFEPSPGNGPPVSSGIIVQSVTVAAVEPAVVVVAPDVVDVDDDAPLVVAVAFGQSLPPEHPATASPSPPRSASAPGATRAGSGGRWSLRLHPSCRQDARPAFTPPERRQERRRSATRRATRTPKSTPARLERAARTSTRTRRALRPAVPGPGLHPPSPRDGRGQPRNSASHTQPTSTADGRDQEEQEHEAAADHEPVDRAAEHPHRGRGGEIDRGDADDPVRQSPCEAQVGGARSTCSTVRAWQMSSTGVLWTLSAPGGN